MVTGILPAGVVIDTLSLSLLIDKMTSSIELSTQNVCNIGVSATPDTRSMVLRDSAAENPTSSPNLNSSLACRCNTCPPDNDAKLS